VTPAIQAERRLQSDRGALIFRITAEVSSKTGLVEGDVLLGVDRTRVATAQQFATLLDAIRPGQPFRIYLDRGGQVVFIDLAF
jgi:S1-C subfamily serine protease